MENSTTNARILIVEDEVHINRLIELILQSDGYYKIEKAFDGKEALKIIKDKRPDLILLDIMIPNIDGFKLCKIIKSTPEYSSIQVIMLTARKMEEDILKGFKNGAIDYISKPFSNKVLLARIKAHLSNLNKNFSSKIYKNIILDEKRAAVKINDDYINLTNFEFKILKLLMTDIGIAFSRSQILTYLRGDDGFNISERAIDVQIVNLRRKLKSLGENIETVRGVGYRLKEE